ncbi:hypothetical protein HK098_000852 [Nowakowskiella sp. JEL0407]|nr:hypothetical protein HK098_000852 [Nowakowskiella sp. JEL0407]
MDKNEKNSAPANPGYAQPIYMPEPVVVDPSTYRKAFYSGFSAGFGASFFFGPLGALVALMFTPSICGPKYPYVKGRSGVFYGAATLHVIAAILVVICYAIVPVCQPSTSLPINCNSTVYSGVSVGTISCQSLCSNYATTFVVIAVIQVLIALAFATTGYCVGKQPAV